MRLIEVPERLIGQLLAAPEVGMGYQSGSLVGTDGQSKQGLFLGSGVFMPNDPTDLLGSPNGSDFSKRLLLEAPGIQRNAETTWRVQLQVPSAVIATAMSAPPALAIPFARPPYVQVTSAGDIFYRLSAFRSDRRVLPDGSLAKQSYSTTETDITVVPNGLAAVGRYALPTRLSARYVFEVRPGAGVSILFGTVTPSFGLAGGGVEVYFPHGTGPGTVKFLKMLPEK